MQVAADVLVRPSRFLNCAVLLMAAAVSCGIGAWLYAMWHHLSDDRGLMFAVGALGAWIVSCVLVYRWWHGQRSWRLVIKKDGMSVHLGATWPDGRDDPRTVLSGRVARDSLAWPGLLIVRLDQSAFAQARDAAVPGPAPQLVVLRDSVSPMAYRALSRWLNWLCHKGIATRVADDTVSNA